MKRICVFVSILFAVALIACVPVQPQPTSNTTIQDAVQPVKEPQASAEFEVTGLKASTDSAIEGDNVSITATIRNKGKGAGLYNVLFKIDTKPAVNEQVNINPGETINKTIAFKEDNACVKYVEVGGRSLVVIFHPHGEKNAENQNGYVTNFTYNRFNFQCNGKEVLLKENFQSKDVSYKEVVAFLNANKYCSLPCFTEPLHNDAEAHGIKCAYVWHQAENSKIAYGATVQTWIEYRSGLSFNGFRTLDRGLVFIEPAKSGNNVVYVEKGKPLGYIDLNNALFSDYGYFEKYSSMMSSEVKRLAELGLTDIKPDYYCDNGFITVQCVCYW
jgi:hypothetical protein